MAERENMLGTMPVGRLVLQMSWPVMLSMLMQAIYNLVDSVYVAQVGDDAFLALSYAYPIQTLMVAFCTGTGVAFSAALAQRLGEKKMGEAGQTVLHGFLFYGRCWVLFLLFGVLASGLYMDLCTRTPRWRRWAGSTSLSAAASPLVSALSSPVSGCCSPRDTPPDL